MQRIVRSLQSAAKSALRPGRLLVPIAIASMLASTGAQALTATSNFNVNINLTASCSIAPMSDITANYTSGQIAALTGAAVQTTAAITCTNGVPYSVALDTGSGGTSFGPLLTAYSDSSLSGGVGITYALGLSDSTFTGNGTAQNVTIQATFGAAQAGSCATATLVSGGCNNSANAARLRTLTVTY